MKDSHLLEIFDRELRIEIEEPGMRKDVFPHLVRFTRPGEGMNFVLYSCLEGLDIDAAIEEQVAYFRQFDQPFEWSVFEHDRPAGMLEHLARHGFDENPEPEQVMVLDLQAAPPALFEPVSVDVRPITRPEQLEDVIRIEAQVWGGDFSWIHRRMGAALAIPGYVNIYAAYVDEQPACTAWVFFYPRSRFAGLYGGSTVPEYRNRGLYSALLSVRAREALRRGYRYLFIDASPMSAPIVARRGFRRLTTVYDCEWKGDRVG